MHLILRQVIIIVFLVCCSSYVANQPPDQGSSSIDREVIAVEDDESIHLSALIASPTNIRTGSSCTSIFGHDNVEHGLDLDTVTRDTAGYTFH